MTDQPALFDAKETPYGISFSNHAAVTTPEHDADLDARFDAWLSSNGHVLDQFCEMARAAKRAENERLRAEIARLRGALEAVEWVQGTGNGDYYCPWCDNNKLVGHHADCQRQTALDAAGGE